MHGDNGDRLIRAQIPLFATTAWIVPFTAQSGAV
jgi:hypothetical protein